LGVSGRDDSGFGIVLECGGTESNRSVAWYIQMKGRFRVGGSRNKIIGNVEVKE
jgi:hypothetical protein